MLGGKSIKHGKDGATDRAIGYVDRFQKIRHAGVTLLVGARPLVAAARPPDLFNRAKHLFDSAKVVPGLTVAPDEKGPALLAGPSRDRSCKRGRVGGIPADTGTGRPGVRVLAKRLGVNVSTVQRISRPFEAAVAGQ
jgi:hypothetical protein